MSTTDQNKNVNQEPENKSELQQQQDQGDEQQPNQSHEDQQLNDNQAIKEKSNKDIEQSQQQGEEEQSPEDHQTINVTQSPLYPREKWVFLESLMQRNGIVMKPRQFTLEVLGVYSLPDFWGKLDGSGAVDAWPYEVKISEALVTGGKYNQRELTEEEKKEMDSKKKPAAKVDKKNPDAAKEEQERLEKEEREKAEKEQQFLEELNALEPMERFYRIKEMKTTGDWIDWNEEVKINNVELSGDNLVNMEDAINDKKQLIVEFTKLPPPDENEKKRPKPKNLNPEDIKPVHTIGLADVSEFSIVPGKKELFLRTPLMLKETYEKRKENNLPIIQSFDPLTTNLNPFEINKTKESENIKKKETLKEIETQQDKSKDKISTIQDNDELDYVEKAHTYIYFKISFNEPLNPKLLSEEERAQPRELFETKKPVEEEEQEQREIKDNEQNEKDEKPSMQEIKVEQEEEQEEQQPQLQPKEENILSEEAKAKELEQEADKGEETQQPLIDKKIKPIAADEMCYDLRKYIKIFISSICKNYEESMGDSNKNQMMKRDKGSLLSGGKKDERDSNITKFQMKYIESGRAAMIKEKLKKFITRVAVEKFKKRVNFNEPFSEQKDKFFSELYAYICDEIKLGMDEFVHIKKDELHENILSSYDQSRKEIINYAIRQTKEPEEKKLLRLSKEYEILDDLETSIMYYKARLTIVQNKEAWLNFAVLAKKMSSFMEVEEAINNCITITEEAINTNYSSSPTPNMALAQSLINDEFNLKILYSAVKYIKGRIKDAIDCLNGLITKYSLKGTNCNFNAFLAFLYHEKGITVQFTKHYEAAKVFKMLELGMNLKKPKINLKVKNEYKRPTLPLEQCDNIWYNLVNFFNEYHFYEISEKLLEFIDENNKQTIKFLIEKAKIALSEKKTDEVIPLCDKIIEMDPDNYVAWVIRGHAYYLKNNLFDSEESYVKGIKCKPQNEKYDIIMLTRLGIIYIRRQTWEDAKTVFLRLLKENVSYAFSWRYLALALTRLGENVAAEEAFNETVILNIENPYSWAYMTMYCISVGRLKQAYECLNEVLSMKFMDIELISDIAQLFYQNNDPITAADLYKRIINIDPKYIDAYIKLADIYYMKFDIDKKREAINILKSSIEYATDEKEKNSIRDFISKYQDQMECGNDNILDHSEMNITGESRIQKDNQGNNMKDSFDHPFFE